jgi:nucleoside-diphosphate-sugar epimerase
MNTLSVIVLGGTGLVGSAVAAHLERLGCSVVSLHSRNYTSHVGASADVLINCNGNSIRFKAGQNPRWDFDASVLTVENSLFDFKARRYVFISTIDVYSEPGDPEQNHEDAIIDPQKLSPYAFHKWTSERLVERFGNEPLILRLGTVIGPGMKKGPLFDLLHGEPLHMSLESELSLIETATVAAALGTFLERPPKHRIINLTGTGSARLSDLCKSAALTPRLSPTAESTTYRYRLNTRRIETLYPIASSMEMAQRFLAGSLKTAP